jgi:hypothetical protein
VVIDVLADGPTLRQTSYAIIFPLVGVLLLAFGIRRRLAWRRWNRSDNDRLMVPRAEPAIPAEDSDRRADLLDPPTRRGRGTGLLIAGTIVTLLGIGHVLSYVATAHVSGAVKADVGQCLTAADFKQRHIGAEPVDCDRTDATVALVSKGDGEASCPDGERDGSLYPVLKGEKNTVCFAWNLREDQCYVSAVGEVTPTACTDPAANVKVASRVDGPGGVGECPADGESLTYHEPKLSYCLVTPRPG